MGVRFQLRVEDGKRKQARLFGRACGDGLSSSKRSNGHQPGKGVVVVVVVLSL